MARKSRKVSIPKCPGVTVKWSPGNQAYFVMWHKSVLRIVQTKTEARDYVKSICPAGQPTKGLRGRKRANARRRR